MHQTRPLSLIGWLHHAASAVVPGRPIIRGLIELSKILKHLNQVVWLNLSARADIEWWLTFARSWNGVTFLPFSQARTSLTSDASGSWGCGSFWNSRWFQLQWADQLHPHHIISSAAYPFMQLTTAFMCQHAMFSRLPITRRQIPFQGTESISSSLSCHRPDRCQTRSPRKWSRWHR